MCVNPKICKDIQTKMKFSDDWTTTTKMSRLFFRAALKGFVSARIPMRSTNRRLPGSRPCSINLAKAVPRCPVRTARELDHSEYACCVTKKRQTKCTNDIKKILYAYVCMLIYIINIRYESIIQTSLFAGHVWVSIQILKWIFLNRQGTSTDP